MAAPRNPYRPEGGYDAPSVRDLPDGLAARARQVEPPIELAVGLHSIDLHNIGVRNYRAGHEAAVRQAAQINAELREQLPTAWDEGRAAGESYADDRAARHVEATLRLIRARLAPTGKATATELQTRLNTVEQLVDGALSIFAPDDMRTVDDADAAEASGFTVRDFALLEKLLIEAAEREGAHDERPLED